MAVKFDSKIAWVTGGGSGIGKALALELAERGADVAVSGRRADRLEAVAEQVRDRGRRGLALPCDVTDERQLDDAVRRLVDELGGLDVAIANAGFAVGGHIEKVSVAQWRRQLDVNVLGLVATAQRALPHLRARGGRLGLVGSVVAFVPISGNGAYCASKAAVRSIGQTLSIELAGSGVSCTTMHPGFVESEINQVDNEGVFRAERTDKRPQQLMWPPDRAARVMVRALYRRAPELVFTAHGKVGAFLGQHFPSLARAVQTRGR